MLGPMRNLKRLAEITRVLVKHKVWVAEIQNNLRQGQRLSLALQELGPAAIKFGQALSLRSDLLGEEFAADLSGLQDRLPPFAGEEAVRVIEAEFSQPLGELFSDFTLIPVAAASIAQVHQAVTWDGQKVAVKVLRPGVREAFARDLALLYFLARWFERLRPDLRRLKAIESLKTLEDTIQMEMDLRFEAAAAAEMEENFADDDDFRIPSVNWQLTGREVMTLEWIDGIPIDEKEELKKLGFDPVKIVEKTATAFFNQVFRDGFFHADMHPGNLFVDSAGKVVAVDFGITGRISLETRRYLGEMLLGFLTSDYRKVAEVHFKAGFVPYHKSVDSFTQACRSIGEPILGKSLNQISIAKLLGQLFKITETFEMETQPQLLMLQKSMLLAEGVGRNLAPDSNMWLLARPLVENWMRANLGLEAKVRNVALDTLRILQEAPHLISEFKGGLRLHPESLKALTGENRTKGFFPLWLPWALVLVLLIIILLKF